MHYFLAVRQMARSLRALDAILDKATKYAEARKFDVNNFCSTRLFPDMLPFVAQIRIACDIAKFTAGYLSGKAVPKQEDNETTMAELRARVASCLQVVDGFKAEDFAHVTSTTLVRLPNKPGKGIAADEYLFARQIPNFYFHVVTAYDLLRHGGVEVGKGDYFGPITWVDV